MIIRIGTLRLLTATPGTVEILPFLGKGLRKEISFSRPSSRYSCFLYFVSSFGPGLSRPQFSVSSTCVLSSPRWESTGSTWLLFSQVSRAWRIHAPSKIGSEDDGKTSVPPVRKSCLSSKVWGIHSRSENRVIGLRKNLSLKDLLFGPDLSESQFSVSSTSVLPSPRWESTGSTWFLFLLILEDCWRQYRKNRHHPKRFSSGFYFLPLISQVSFVSNLLSLLVFF